MRHMSALLLVAFLGVSQGTRLEAQFDAASLLDVSSSSFVGASRMLANSIQTCSCVYNKIYGTMKQRLVLVGSTEEGGNTTFNFRLLFLNSSATACSMAMTASGGMDCCNSITDSFNISMTTGSDFQVVKTTFNGNDWSDNTLVGPSNVAFYSIPHHTPSGAPFTITIQGEHGGKLPCSSSSSDIDGMCDYLLVGVNSGGAMCCGMGALSADAPLEPGAPPSSPPDGEFPGFLTPECVSSLVYGQSRYRLSYTSVAPSGSHTKYFFKISAVSPEYCCAACYRADGNCCEAPLTSFTLAFTGEPEDVVAASVNGSDWLAKLNFNEDGLTFSNVSLTAADIPEEGVQFSITLADGDGIPCGPSALDPTSSDVCDYYVNGANCCNQGLMKAPTALPPAPAPECLPTLEASPYRLQYVSKATSTDNTTVTLKLSTVPARRAACETMDLTTLTLTLGESALSKFTAVFINGTDVTTSAVVRPTSLTTGTLTIKNLVLTPAKVAAAPLSVEVLLEGEVDTLCGGEPEEVLALGLEACSYSFLGASGMCCPTGVTPVTGADITATCSPPKQRSKQG